MFDWINDLWSWVTAVFDALKYFLRDLPILILDQLLSALADVINSIQVPDFLSSSIGSYLDNAPEGVLYMIDVSGVSDGLLIIASGYAFRLTRKFLTLFQW